VVVHEPTVAATGDAERGASADVGGRSQHVDVSGAEVKKIRNEGEDDGE